MAIKFKSESEVLDLARALRERRKSLGYTLKHIEKLENINCGQLSRFERGEFKTKSSNLQKYIGFLQTQGAATWPITHTLGERIEEFAARSPKHREAAEEFLKALEHLP